MLTGLGSFLAPVVQILGHFEQMWPPTEAQISDGAGPELQPSHREIVNIGRPKSEGPRREIRLSRGKTSPNRKSRILNQIPYKVYSIKYY